MDYVIELVGSDHVAVGTDIFSDPSDGVWWRAVTGRLYREVAHGMTYETHNIDGFEHAADFPHVVQAMLDHGYDDTLIGKIVGGNWLRVFQQVWGA
jgi:membrane dipeptidase